MEKQSNNAECVVPDGMRLSFGAEGIEEENASVLCNGKGWMKKE